MDWIATYGSRNGRIRWTALVLIGTFPALAGAVSPDIVVSQVCGHGGNRAPIWKSDFIELYNRGPASVDVSTWSVQYAAGNGTSWTKVNLVGVIASGRYFLIQGATNTGGVGTGNGGLPLPLAGDIVSPALNVSVAAGKVALVNHQSRLSGAGCPLAPGVVDFVGYGGASTCFETAAAAATGVLTGLIRRMGGCQDTDNNAADFLLGTPIPRNSGSAANGLCVFGETAPSAAVSGAATLITVSVPPAAPPSTGLAVTCDLTPIGGGAAQSFFDDGTHGDTLAGDGVFSFTVVVNSPTAGLRLLPAAATDAQGRSGAAPLAFRVNPANDACTGAIELPCNSSLAGSTINATLESPPVPACGAAGAQLAGGVWYRVVGTGAAMTASTCGADAGYDTKLSLYAGGCGGLACLAGNDDDAACTAWGTFRSTLTWNSIPGVEYLLLVHGFDSSQVDDFVLSLAASPANDSCANAAPAGAGATAWSNCGAVSDGPPLSSCGAAAANIFSDVWFGFMATCTGTIALDTCGASATPAQDVADTVLAVYPGGDCQTLTAPLACNDNFAACPLGGLRSQVTFMATQGATYWIRVGSADSAAQGTGVLHIDVPADTTPPVISACAGDALLVADAQCQAPAPDLTGMVQATDNCPAAVTIGQTPAPGAAIPLGPTLVTLTATDAAGNSSTCAATVTVLDASGPTINACAAGQVLVGDSDCLAPVPDLTMQVAAADNCGGGLLVMQSPEIGALIGCGSTSVTLTVGDAAGNTAACTALLTVTCPRAIVSANPPNGYRDTLQDTTTALQPQGIGVAGTPPEGPVSYAMPSFVLSGAPCPALTAASVSVACTDISGNGPDDCPTVVSLTGSDAGPYLVELSGPIPLRECTTFSIAGTLPGQALRYTFMPVDSNLNGTVTGQDVLATVTAIENGTAGGDLARFDVNRNGLVTGQDVLREIQLMNGVLSSHSFNGLTVAPCP